MRVLLLIACLVSFSAHAATTKKQLTTYAASPSKKSAAVKGSQLGPVPPPSRNVLIEREQQELNRLRARRGK